MACFLQASKDEVWAGNKEEDVFSAPKKPGDHNVDVEGLAMRCSNDDWTVLGCTPQRFPVQGASREPGRSRHSSTSKNKNQGGGAARGSPEAYRSARSFKREPKCKMKSKLWMVRG